MEIVDSGNQQEEIFAVMNRQPSSQSPTDTDQKYLTEENGVPKTTRETTPEVFIDLTAESEAEDFQVIFLFLIILRNLSYEISNSRAKPTLKTT